MLMMKQTFNGVSAKAYYLKYSDNLKSSETKGLLIDLESKYPSRILEELRVPPTYHNRDRLFYFAKSGTSYEHFTKDLDQFVDKEELDESQFIEIIKDYMLRRDQHPLDRFGFPQNLCALLGYPTGPDYYNFGLVHLWMDGTLDFDTMMASLATHPEDRVIELQALVDQEYGQENSTLFKTILFFTKKRQICEKIKNYFQHRGIRLYDVSSKSDFDEILNTQFPEAVIMDRELECLFPKLEISEVDQKVNSMMADFHQPVRVLLLSEEGGNQPLPTQLDLCSNEKTISSILGNHSEIPIVEELERHFYNSDFDRGMVREMKLLTV